MAGTRVRPEHCLIAHITASCTDGDARCADRHAYPIGVTRWKGGTGKVMSIETNTPREADMSALEYEIRVSGLVPESVLAEIEGVHVVVEPVQTVMRGPVLDQAALHGIINRLQRLGLDLIEVRRLSDQDA